MVVPLGRQFGLVKFEIAAPQIAPARFVGGPQFGDDERRRRLHDMPPVRDKHNRGTRTGGAMLLFRQLFDPQSSTYTYLLAERRGGRAVLIGPVFEQARRDAALIDELGLTLVATLETHVHADHVTGAWLLKRRFGSQIMLSA